MFTTVNSLNSINIIGRCTDQCMLPIHPFYRLPFYVSKNIWNAFVESTHFQIIDFLHSYPSISELLTTCSICCIVCIIVLFASVYVFL